MLREGREALKHHLAVFEGLLARRDWLAQNLGPASVSVIADAGHWLQYEQAARFDALALRFFSQVQS